ncbi:hypothetical protein ACEPAI_7458 [Sanghuangporus weigelae]
MSSASGSPELDSTYGCLFLTAILWSIGCLQLLSYLEKHFRADKLWLKIYTVLLWILDTVYLILILRIVYIYFVREFGNIGFLDRLPKYIYVSSPFSPIIATMVQSLFVSRAWHLSKSYILTSGLAICVVAQFVATIVYIQNTRHFNHLEQLATIVNFERAMNIIVLFTDTAIAVILFYLLWNLRSGFEKTEGIIKRLVAYTVGTGLITSIMAIIAFVTAEVIPHSFAYLMIDYCMATLYFNCMLASLNARTDLRERMSGPVGGLNIRLDELASTSQRARPGNTAIKPGLQESYDHDAINGGVGANINPRSSEKVDYIYSLF